MLIDAKDLVEEVFLSASSADDEPPVFGVICDFIEGEVRNLKKGLDTLEKLQTSASSRGFYFRTKYNSYEGAKRALDDFPNPEMAESVLDEYDKKLELSETGSRTTALRKGSDSKSKFGDFSLLTVAAICAARRKRQSIVVSRDRWIKLSCQTLRERFKLLLYCEDQWSFSIPDIVTRANIR